MPDESEKLQLRPAGTNPWYVLMTVAGENTGSPETMKIREDRRARNRRYWNGWQARGLRDFLSAQLIRDGQIKKEDFEPGGDLSPLTDKENAAVIEELKKRCPDAQWPDPKKRVDFCSTEFVSVLDAHGLLFPMGADFDGATFTTYADFRQAIFSQDSHFRHAVFSGGADFGSSFFIFNADFSGATFSRDTVFSDATFGQAIFRKAVFQSIVNFEIAKFPGPAIFRGATFSEDAVFVGAMFSSRSDFRNTTFKETTAFAVYIYDEPSNPAQFLLEPPQFYGATLHEDTDFTDVEWPLVPHDTHPERRRGRAIRYRHAYERLKLLMDGQKKVADELMFHRLELQCREVEAPGAFRALDWVKARGSRLLCLRPAEDCRKIEAEAEYDTRDWTVRWVSRLFGVLSDYGWDPARPFLYLLGAVLVGWVLIGGVEWWLCNLSGWESFLLSASNVIPLFGFGRTFLAEEVRTLSPFSEFISTLQTIFGLILLFLLGLALRNRFRIK